MGAPAPMATHHGLKTYSQTLREVAKPYVEIVIL
jgi:hypothetical protein